MPPNPPTIHSSSSSLHSWQPVSRDGSRSRRVSIDESLESGPNTTQNSPQLSPLRVPSLSDMRSPSESRGRRKASGFSLASVSNAIMDVVRSSSPRNRRPFGAGSRSTERDFHLDENSSRGRTREKAKPSLTTNDDSVERSRSRQKGWSKDRLTLGVIGDILKPDADDRIDGERWREFKAGNFFLVHLTEHILNPQCEYAQVHIPTRYHSRYPGMHLPLYSVISVPFHGLSPQMSTVLGLSRLSCPLSARLSSCLVRPRRTPKTPKTLSWSAIGTNNCSTLSRYPAEVSTSVAQYPSLLL